MYTILKSLLLKKRRVLPIAKLNLIDNIPDEILRKILCYLPCNKFLIANSICKKIRSFNLIYLLIPWKLELLFPILQNISEKERLLKHDYYFNRYKIISKNQGLTNYRLDAEKLSFIVCSYDLIDSISRIIGDYTIWDSYDYIYTKKKSKCIMFKDNFYEKSFFKFINNKYSKYREEKNFRALSKTHIPSYKYNKYFRDNLKLKALIY